MLPLKILGAIARSVGRTAINPVASAGDLGNLGDRGRGRSLHSDWPETPPTESGSSHPASPNPLQTYFDGVKEGPGIWKWLHYFEIYHRHLSKFIGQNVTIVEIGVFSGGSMPMWRKYFGEGASIHGIDIQPECKAYENEHTVIHIGDQANRDFWRAFREKVPVVDVLIDDGGHTPEQQMVTLEEMLPHVRPGGVYVCEDVHGIGNRFAAFSQALADGLNTRIKGGQPTPFQRDIHSVHHYPFVVVVEKRETPLEKLVAEKHGTQWQPFYNK